MQKIITFNLICGLIVCLHISCQKEQELSKYNWKSCSSDLFTRDYIRIMVIDSSDNKWIGTDNGLYKFNNSDDNKWICSHNGILKFDKNQTWTIINDTLFATSVVIDINNNVWIGSSKGLLMFDGNIWTVYNTNQ